MDCKWVGANPIENSGPAKDQMEGRQDYMGRVTIDRHGGINPNRDVRAFPLPGKNNMSFLDGHAELAKLNDYYKLYWHRLWKEPSFPPLPN